MKIRAGYVSNSSSSSFLVYGQRTKDFDKVGEWLREGKKVIGVDRRGGSSGDCEDFVFVVTEERYDLLKNCVSSLKSREVEYISTVFTIVEHRFDERVEMPSLSGGRFYRYNRDYSSPSTDAVDDEKFVEWTKWRLEASK